MRTNLKCEIFSILVAALILPQVAYSIDLGYRYDYSTSKCRNKNGLIGLNPAYLGECGGHSGQQYTGYNLESRGLMGSDFSYGRLDEASLFFSDLRSSNFESAYMPSANFSNTRLEGANLKNVRAAKASFFWANLQGANLTGADFSFADFRGASLDLSLVSKSTTFSNAIFDQYTSLPFSSSKAFELGMKFIPSEE